MNEPNEPRPMSTNIYWWVAIFAIVEMLLLFWLTRAFNVPMPGGS